MTIAGAYEWEGVAEWVLSKARGDARAIARGLAIEVFAVPNLRAMAQLGSLRGAPIIGYRQSAPPEYQEHAICHEIGHWAMAEQKVQDSEEGAELCHAGYPGGAPVEIGRMLIDIFIPCGI